MNDKDTIAPGLRLLPNFISKEEEMDLLKSINKQSWGTQLSRRVQHYGYRYDYKNKNLAEKLGDLPEWSEFIVDRIQHTLAETNTKFNQMIINEYKPGQGIAAHTDSKMFGPIIVSLSLGSDTVMRFVCKADKTDLVLPRRSLLILQDEARYNYTHEIPKRASDLINGQRKPRGLRVSMTLRTYSQ